MSQTAATPTEAAAPRTLRAIAAEITQDWDGKINYGAKPYLEAMAYLETLNEKYGLEDGRDIVTRFLLNAGSWRGETARRVKAELRAMLAAR